MARMSYRCERLVGCLYMGNIYVTKNAIVVYLESLMISYPGQNSIKMESDGLDHTNSRPLALQTVFSY